MSVLLVATPIIVGVVVYVLLSKKLDKLGVSMATAKEQLQDVAQKLNKAHNEIIAKINDGTVSADDIAPLAQAAQALDDIVPDVEEESDDEAEV